MLNYTILEATLSCNYKSSAKIIVDNIVHLHNFLHMQKKNNFYKKINLSYLIKNKFNINFNNVWKTEK